MDDSELHSPDKNSFLQEALQQVENDTIKFISLRSIRNRLKKVWAEVLPPETISPPIVRKHKVVEGPKAWRSYIHPIEYSIGMSDDFLKEIQKIDRNIQGRILQAIGRISRHPAEQQGDTVKPLSGDLKGLWRYRIGDYRLIYKPDATSQNVLLVAIASRGSVYE